ncbi:MAG: PorV/PorQ family protein [Candidatus Cloacimonetes bacterium]|nr:PorV/PorQ family protein [Candidatus Cloacimonadota bacterium]
MKKFFLLVMSFTITTGLFAISEDAGTTAFNFLNIPMGARGAGMGNSFTAVSDDALAPFWNAAGLPNVRAKLLQVTYINYFAGYNGGAASYTMPLKEGSTIAVFSKFMGVGGIPKTGIDGNQNLVDLGTFGSYDVMLGVSYGKYLSEIINWGVNLKVISETIDEYSSQAVAADVCILHQSPNPRLKIGLAARNLGMQLSKFDQEKEKLPLTFSLGLAYKLNTGVLALDVHKPMHTNFYGTIGLETTFQNKFTVRAGYRTNASDWKVGSGIDFLSGISAGVGFSWKDYQFDYAVNSYGELGFIHQLSVGYHF